MRTNNVSWSEEIKRSPNSGKKLSFYDLSKNGEHKVKFFGPILRTYVHFTSVNGDDKITILCYKDEDFCPSCNIRSQYFCFVLDILEKTLHYTRFPESLMSEFRSLSRASGEFVEDTLDNSLLIVTYKNPLYRFLKYHVKTCGEPVELTDEQMKLMSTYDLGQHANLTNVYEFMRLVKVGK